MAVQRHVNFSTVRLVRMYPALMSMIGTAKYARGPARGLRIVRQLEVYSRRGQLAVGRVLRDLPSRVLVDIERLPVLLLNASALVLLPIFHDLIDLESLYSFLIFGRFKYIERTKSKFKLYSKS